MMDGDRFQYYRTLAEAYTVLVQPVGAAEMHIDPTVAEKVVQTLDLRRGELRSNERNALDKILQAGIDTRPRHKTEPAWDDPTRCPAIQFSEGYHLEADRYFACYLLRGHEGMHATRVGQFKEQRASLRPQVAVTVVVPEEQVEFVNGLLYQYDERTMRWVVGTSVVEF